MVSANGHKMEECDRVGGQVSKGGLWKSSLRWRYFESEWLRTVGRTDENVADRRHGKCEDLEP